MTTEHTGDDLVISYTVDEDGKLSAEYPKLKTALESGYRVIEIISTPLPVGGQGKQGGVCITVLLLTGEAMVNTKYVGKNKP